MSIRVPSVCCFPILSHLQITKNGLKHAMHQDLEWRNEPAFLKCSSCNIFLRVKQFIILVKPKVAQN